MRRRIRFIIRSIALCFVLLLMFPLPAFAANRVNTIDIHVVLYEDGSMLVTQVWEGSFEEGTEVYIPMNTPDYMTISGLKVSGPSGAYDTVPDWDIDWSFEEKAGKCGIHYTDGGYEICFGITQYGRNSYTIEYRLDNVVAGYSDRDGVNFRFVNDQMNTTPTDARVEIRLADGTAITDEIADIWGFGFEGEVAFEDGRIVARTSSPLSFKNHVTILFSLERGILFPSRQESSSFGKVREEAFSGSDYDSGEEATFSELVIVFLIIFILPIVLFVLIKRIKRKMAKAKMRRFSERFGYFRDIPNEGNISATYALGRLFGMCEDGAILGTGILRLIQLDCLAPVTDPNAGFMGKTRETISLRLTRSRHDKMNEFDEYLYTVLESAAGSDGVLQPKELERFANRNDTLLRDYIKKHEITGRAYLNQKRCLKRWKTPARLTDLTPSGEKELGELLGLKRYLEDFSLIAERGVKEIPIWRELLTYAMLFGIADRVSEQMKELYPSLFSELVVYNQSMAAAYSYHYLLYSNMRKAEQEREQAKRSAGSGGFASIGGGGGSIGGGSGGGTR